MKKTFKQFLLESSDQDDLDGYFTTFQTKNAKARRWPNEMWDHIKNTIKNDPSHRFVGAGSNAYVSKKDNPQHMDYVQRTSAANDGGAAYQIAIYNNKQIQTNHYAPRILSIDNPNSNYPTINLEPLVEFRKLSTNEQVLQHYLNKIFVDGSVTLTQIPALPQHLISLLGQAIQSRGENVKDPQMLQLIDFIYQVQKNNQDKFFIDIHDDNVMWRLTANGPQLVIIDPLAD